MYEDEEKIEVREKCKRFLSDLKEYKEKLNIKEIELQPQFILQEKHM